MNKQRKRAPVPVYVSPDQLSLECFQTPFNQWVIPWDDICNLYLKHVGVASTGKPTISPRVVIGSLIIKYICNLDDRETIMVPHLNNNSNKGRIIFDATACPQDIAYPTDLDLLPTARKKSEEFIGRLPAKAICKQLKKRTSGEMKPAKQ